jgi:predicted dehydrogenase
VRGAAALAGAATRAAAQDAPARKAGRTMDKVRIGVVGDGFGRSFYWHDHPDCIVQAVSDLGTDRRNALMKTYRCERSYPSLEKLILDKSIDAVAVFTEAPHHVRHCVACLNAGKHVICAVPAAMTLEECGLLLETVRKTGLTYMMAETSWYHQSVISARKWFAEGKFGEIYYTEAEYHHPGLESLWFFGDGKPTWRHGLPPMNYPTHCTAYLVGVTGERMTTVTCTGWGDDHKGPVGGCERGQWFGEKMSFYDPHPNGTGHVIRRPSDVTEKDDAGFERYEQPQWWRTDMLPKPLRRDSGHDGSHTFLTHEFIDALVHGRPPAVDVHESLAMTAPGIVAHASALKGGVQMKVPSFDAGAGA